MLAARIALAFASLGALPAAAGSQPVPAPADRILVDHADGSWTITRAIGEEPVALEIATRGLIAGGKDANRLRQGEGDEAAERAFEEAIEQARREQRPQ